MAEEISTEETVFNISLKSVKGVPRTRRAIAAIAHIRKFIVQHMKADAENVWIDGHVGEYIWSRGIRKPPTKITVRAVKFEDGLVEVSFPEEP
ncbi:MAG: 50S ribosomal protein L31e [Candidatus Thermoplasmatota archaeon]|jgi:large subunit ribosomal protein L31e|nr:50S ribosomal protein L31e [Candidatus Sysuiplasma jiujiangense]MBX8639457.1 50S ribosomal protein L31e [Candidatus Sysuiplasma jiujiangense]MBX8642599.1 50S ribosomal protein L31e [Candidatus Sysuiplasma jiujiangense]MCL4317665.1 50S ribosomal protein L31e [Candidatus Thermoplasmatota archaeon]